MKLYQFFIFKQGYLHTLWGSIYDQFFVQNFYGVNSAICR
jgi:hypothetical protein